MKNLNLIFLASLVLAILFITLFTAPVVSSAGGKEALTVRYVDGQWICTDGAVFRLRLIEDPRIPFRGLQEPNYLVMPYEKYLKLREEGKLTIEAMKIHCLDVNTGNTLFTIALIEPEITKVVIPISGSLTPGTGHLYGPYSSCVTIWVSVTWSPGSQILGIAIADAETGEGYGTWYIGGSAQREFITDWMRSYYIFIMSHPDNTRTITYSGTITLYVW
jgi:hypothetical protein